MIMAPLLAAFVALASPGPVPATAPAYPVPVTVGTTVGPRTAADTVLTLSEVVDSALATHPTLAGAEARRRSAEAAAAETRASWLPTVSAMAVATRYEEPMVVAPLHGFSFQSPPAFDETLYQAHATAEYTLFDGGARAARTRAASARAAALESAAVVAREEVLVEATTAYLSALTARDVLRARDRWVAALSEERDRSRLLFREGRAPRLTVLRTEAALSRARAEREAAAEGLELALRRLSRVSGVDADRVLGSELVEVAVRDTVLPARETLVERALGPGSPAVAQASGRVAASEGQAAAARSSFLPRLSLSGRYSAYGAAAVEPTGEWQAGVQVSYPLFTGGARGAGVERAEAETEAARAERRRVEQQLADAVDAALSAYRTARARTRALEAAVAQSVEVARIEALALESGAGVQTDYLRAEAELAGTRSALAQARHAAVEARLRLARATGDLSVSWLARMTERAEQ